MKMNLFLEKKERKNSLVKLWQKKELKEQGINLNKFLTEKD